MNKEQKNKGTKSNRNPEATEAFKKYLEGSMPLSRAEIAAMTKEERATFMTKNWDLIKEACDKIGGETVEALKNMKPSLYGIGGTRVGGSSGAKWKLVLAKFEKINDKVNEMELFKEFKIGEKEVHKLIKLAIKDNEDGKIKWIEFKDGDYILRQIGGKRPERCIFVNTPKEKQLKPEAPKNPLNATKAAQPIKK